MYWCLTMSSITLVFLSTRFIRDIDDFLVLNRTSISKLIIYFLMIWGLLGLMCCSCFSFPSLDNSLLLHTSLVSRKHGYASVVWNSLTNIDSNKIRLDRRMFSSLSYNRRLTNHNSCTYSYVLDKFKFRRSYVRGRSIEVLFIRNLYEGFITCSSFKKLLVSEFHSETLGTLIHFVFCFTQ
jgi:hypothetical protein